MSCRKTVELSSGNWPSIATVCVLGEPSSSVKKNEAKKKNRCKCSKGHPAAVLVQTRLCGIAGRVFRQPEYIGHCRTRIE